MREETRAEAEWWKTAVIYQAYPRSFQDSNGDGIGDLNGIRRRLSYLSALGVDAVWISPFYPSPMADFGYDVADYCDVDPLFGTLADCKALIAEAHALSLKVILEFVPNHTSEQHPWFIESRSSRHNPKRDWYMWRDASPGGGPPNNWVSHFGGRAWEWDEGSGQYYYHAYLKEQPDLNWRNREVRAAMHDVFRFWMELGVDGFRVDVIWHLMKDAEFRDNPPNPDHRPGQPEIDRLLPVHSADQQEVHEVIEEMRAVVDEYEHRVLIGEIYLPLERLMAYYGRDLKGAHLPFNFQLLQAPWTAEAIARLVEEYEAALPEGAWPNWVLGNHDRPRIETRVGEEQAKVAAVLLLTLRGTPTIYYGDELGMADVPIPAYQIQDPWSLREPGIGAGRDPVRTPMQWDPSSYAGFSTTRPWLPLADNWSKQNVESLEARPLSIFNVYRRLLALRRKYQALSLGRYETLSCRDDVLCLARSLELERLVVLLNFSQERRTVPFDNIVPTSALLSTVLDRSGETIESEFTLEPNEAVIFAAGS
jgi:alpha-glucosidase